MNKTKQLQKRNVLSRAEYEAMIANSNGECLLCDASKQIVIQEFDKFLWISSISPYWKYNTMIIPKRHVEQFHQFYTEELKDLQDITKYVTEKYIRLNYHRGGEHPDHDNVIFFWRFRDPARNTKKTAHLHLHVSPNPDHLFDPVLDAEAANYDPLLFHSL